MMKVNIIYGVSGLTDSVRGVIRSELRNNGCEVLDDSTVREIKSGIDQSVDSYAEETQLVLIISQALDKNNPFQIGDLLRYQKAVRDIRILIIVDASEKGSELLREMSNNGMYLAVYANDTSPQTIGDLIVNGRNVTEAKRYYAVNTTIDTRKSLTIDGAVDHMMQPIKSKKDYIERAGWVKKTLASEDAFTAFVKKLPDEVKDILGDNKTYYPYVEDYILAKSETGIRPDKAQKEKKSFFGRNKEKALEKEQERLSKEHERLNMEAERRAEEERLEAEKRAEKAQIEAEKQAERERLEAERAAEREKAEAEKAEKAEKAERERERIEAEKKAREEEKAQKEAEKKAERERAEAEKARKAEEEAEKKRERMEMEAEIEQRNRVLAEAQAKEDAIRREKMRIEAEAKAKADLEFRREEAERRERERAAIRAEKAAKEEAFFLSAGDVKNVVKSAIRRTVIGVAGAQRHIGCTHQALLIAHSLSSMGFKVALIEDYNQADKVFDSIADENGKDAEEMFAFNGVDYYPCFSLKQLPSLNVKNYNFVVVDFGLYDDDMIEEYGRCSLQVLVSGSRVWETKQLGRIFSSVTEDQLMTYNYLFLGTPEAKKPSIKKDMLPLKNVFFGEYAPNPYASDGYAAIREILDDFIVTEDTEAKKKSGGLLGMFGRR